MARRSARQGISQSAGDGLNGLRLTGRPKRHELLSLLAVFGIRRCDLEWDGLPLTAFEAAPKDWRDS